MAKRKVPAPSCPDGHLDTRIRSYGLRHSANPEGGCVGDRWQDWVSPVLEPERCVKPAHLRECPTPSHVGHEATIVNAARMYCDDHWSEHLEAESAWVSEHGLTTPNEYNIDPEQPFEVCHPDAVYTAPLVLGEPLLRLGGVLSFGLVLVASTVGLGAVVFLRG